MSNALAIASATAVLKNLLTNGLIDKDPVASLGDFTVSTLPPDRIRVDQANEANRLNLFLYHVTPNPAWRNVALPARDSSAALLTNPPLALDLHYLLTAYGTENLHAEILLGYAMQVLHETPVISRDAIRAALTSPNPVTGSVLPTALKSLAASELAEQLEPLKITPQALSTEEMSKLWSALQAHYRPTAVYQVSVVLIEGRRPVKPTLPVRARNVYAIPFPQPLVNAVDAASGANDFIEMGATLVVKGERLRGQTTQVLIDGFPFTPAVNDLSDTRIELAVPATLRAGIRALQVAQELNIGTPPVPHRGVESNVAAFLLHPKITVPAAAAGNLAIAFAPNVGKTQRVKLLLGEHPPPPDRAARAYSLDAPANNGLTAPAQEDTASVTFPLTGVATGSYLVRAQVDGAESALLGDTSDGSPTCNQFIGPKVTITA